MESATPSYDPPHYQTQSHHAPGMRRASRDVLSHEYTPVQHTSSVNDCSSPSGVPTFVPRVQPATTKGDHLSSSSLQSVCSSDSVFSDSILTPPCPISMPTLLSHTGVPTTGGQTMQVQQAQHPHSHGQQPDHQAEAHSASLQTRTRSYSQSSGEVVRHAAPYPAATSTDGQPRYTHAPDDDYNPQAGVLNSYAAAGPQQVITSPT